MEYIVAAASAVGSAVSSVGSAVGSVAGTIGTATGTGVGGTVGSLASTAASLGGSIYSMISSPGTPKLQLPGAPQEGPSKAAEDAAYSQAMQLRKRRGAASTILTGPQGVAPQGGNATLGA